jgi:hypothetical protein
MPEQAHSNREAEVPPRRTATGGPAEPEEIPAGNGTECRFTVQVRSHYMYPYSVNSPSGVPVDLYRLRAAAERAARELNAGLAVWRAGTTLGCRVMPR